MNVTVLRSLWAYLCIILPLYIMSVSGETLTSEDLLPLCEYGYFACNSSDNCVEQKRNCDGISDCPDSSDEQNCEDNSRTEFWNNMFRKRPDEDREKRMQKCAFEEIPFECKCSGGSVFCENRSLQEIPHPLPSHVVELDLSGNRIMEIGPTDFPLMTSVRILIFNSAHVSRLSSHSFKNLPTLRKLYLVGNYLSTIPNDTFLENPFLRLLILSHNEISNLHIGAFQGLENLSELDLRENKISSLHPEIFQPLRNLRILWLDNNKLEEIKPGTFYHLSSLKILSIQSNYLSRIKETAFLGLHQLQSLSLGWNKLLTLESDSFGNIISLINLDLEGNQITTIHDSAFSGGLPNLQTLNLKNNKLTNLHSDIFTPLSQLTHIYFQDFRMCSFALHVRVCEPRGDGISSVTHLLDSLVLRIFVWLVASLACSGNFLVLVGRHLVKETNEVHSIYIKNLAVADFLMGVYLFLIAAHDTAFRGEYVNHDMYWRHSWRCKFCGTLSTLSSEASVFMLTVITTDRYVSILYPFSLRRRTIKFAAISSTIAWSVATLIAVLPVMDFGYYGPEYYGNNGVCLPLHIHDPFAQAWEYSLFVFCGINTVAFLFILISYVRMFTAIQRSSVNSRSSQQLHDRTIAKRFAFIVGTDMICWVPVIFVKFLAVGGVNIDEELYAWVAVFLLPVNSALNPVLYTLTTKLFKQHIVKIVQKWRFSSSLSVATDTSAISLSSILNARSYKMSINGKPAEVDPNGRNSSLLSQNCRIPAHSSWQSPSRIPPHHKNNYF